MSQQKKMTLTAEIRLAEGVQVVSAVGQVARTLKALVESENAGITALEVSNTWALRLSAYVHTLRHEYGLEIETKREPHEGGYHARYVLHTPVEIIE